MSKVRKYLKITGYEGAEVIYKREVLAGTITDKKLEELLRCLVSKYLEEDEVIESLLKKNSKGRRDLLDITRNGTRFMLSCGENPHFVAEIVTK
ncbi:hypothetical protein [Thalassospira tepidiphila]|uniref:hypothetical protein n=1 Tax=Thalassospira tepidiphila TaxID=393657 RepID=UPI003AA9191F